MTQFTEYNDVIFDAFCLHNKRSEIIDRKQDIINKISDYYNSSPDSILYVGFNPAILAAKAKEIYVSSVSDRVLAWIRSQGVNALLIDEPRQFDLVVALDEYLTFAETEQDQKSMISQLCGLSKGLVVTTVKDYKNQDFKDREYSQPAIIKSNNKLTAFTEIHDWDQRDKNVWTTSIYQMSGMESTCRGQFDRRALFFKQLAKFSIDAGAGNFLVHKNIMYKSIVKKNYEHVISIQFQ